MRLVPLDIAYAIENSQERLRRAFEALPDSEKAEVVAEIEKRLEEALLYGSGPADGLLGKEK